ncbi:hypothetical protein CRYUN_Cryun03dG0089400 [Craigia yunnanensis]
MLFSFLPFCVAGIIKSRYWKLSGLILWVLGLYSILGHKEFRQVCPPCTSYKFDILWILTAALERGTEDVMNYLSNKAVKEKVKSLLFLMPCHAHTLLFAHRGYKEKGIPDESDRLMMDPVGFAVDFTKNWSQPSRILLFDSEEKQLRNFLVSHSFREVRRFLHAHFKVDRNLQASVVVYAMTGT